MNLRRAAFIAALGVAAASGQALAQFPPAAAQQGAASPWDQAPQPAPQQRGAASPWEAAPQTAPWPGQSQQQQQQAQGEKCLQDFMKLRDDAQKKAGHIQAASKNKVSPKEACGLFNSFSASEVKLIKYSEKNMAGCGIPKDAIEQMKKNHAHTDGLRTRVCQAAAAGPARPAGPSLSDALNAPIADSTNIKTGRGTFDTLTGTPLGPK
ncbi:MAG: hypothetical protein ABI830_08950 [Pseudolabrys sp.]